MLTIGVRGLRSAIGIFKPQIVYTAPMAGDTGEIRTDPSSDPAAKDANFLVIQKIPLKLPYDFELAPVVNIAARDNLFGGVIQIILFGIIANITNGYKWSLISMLFSTIPIFICIILFMLSH